jgi:hypothetical protein
MAAKQSTPTGIGDAIDTMLSETDGQDKVSVADVLETFGRRSFGPLILVPAILLTLPTGALPGVPIVLGALIALVCLEILIGRKQPSIPSLFSKLKFSRSGLEKARSKANGVIKAIDGLIQPRLEFLVRPPLLQLAALACIALCLLLIPVEVIPFATAIPGTALIIMGVAITAHDGLAMAIGLAATGAAGFAVYQLVF